MTRIYADTADLREIERAVNLGPVRGATTNPSLLASHGVGGIREHVRAICELVEESVSVQVVGNDPAELIEQGYQIASWHPRTVVKIAMTPAGTQAARHLADRGIRTNVTTICSAAQALLALNTGASIVCCYIGRVADRGEDPLRTVEDVANWIARGGYRTELMAASIRTPEQAVDVARAGATILTLPLRVIETMYAHPVGSEAVARFEADWRARPGAVDEETKRLLLR